MKPSLTPISDAFEVAIAKMMRDLAASKGDANHDQIGIRLSLAVIPPAIRALGAEMDAGTNREQLLAAYSQTIANLIVSIGGSLANNEAVTPTVVAMFLRRIIDDTFARVDVAALPDNVKSVGILEPQPTGSA